MRILSARRRLAVVCVLLTRLAITMLVGFSSGASYLNDTIQCTRDGGTRRGTAYAMLCTSASRANSRQNLFPNLRNATLISLAAMLDNFANIPAYTSASPVAHGHGSHRIPRRNPPRS
eukprot:1926918-Pyramimonas_sp.AAC.2